MPLINQTDLARLQGVSRSTVIEWTRQGLPVAEDLGAGREKLYDQAAAMAWCKAHRKGTSWAAISARNRKGALQRRYPQSADVCDGIPEEDLARSLALARVELLADELKPEDGFEPSFPGVSSATVMQVVSCYLDYVAIALRAAGYPEVDEILAELQSPAGWEGTLEECIARARAEVPQ